MALIKLSGINNASFAVGTAFRSWPWNGTEYDKRDAFCIQRWRDAYKVNIANWVARKKTVQKRDSRQTESGAQRETRRKQGAWEIRGWRWKRETAEKKTAKRNTHATFNTCPTFSERQCCSVISYNLSYSYLDTPNWLIIPYIVNIANGIMKKPMVFINKMHNQL